jgi:hypothetical protein
MYADDVIQFLAVSSLVYSFELQAGAKRKSGTLMQYCQVSLSEYITCGKLISESHKVQPPPLPLLGCGLDLPIYQC